VATILIIFAQNQLTKFNACSLSNKGKLEWRNKCKSRGNFERLYAE